MRFLLTPVAPWSDNGYGLVELIAELGEAEMAPAPAGTPNTEAPYLVIEDSDWPSRVCFVDE